MTSHQMQHCEVIEKDHMGRHNWLNSPQCSRNGKKIVLQSHGSSLGAEKLLNNTVIILILSTMKQTLLKWPLQSWLKWTWYLVNMIKKCMFSMGDIMWECIPEKRDWFCIHDSHTYIQLQTYWQPDKVGDEAALRGICSNLLVQLLCTKLSAEY